MYAGANSVELKSITSPVLARLHARIVHVRADFTHKLTTRRCRENQALAIDNLHVKGMLANARLARAIADVGQQDGSGQDGNGVHL